MRTVCGGHATGGRRWRGSLELEGAGDARRCRLLRAAWAVAGLVALLAVFLLAVLVAVDAHADRRRQWTTYGSARGRLVVACDMRSSTCSDGRRITTVRASPVPCEVSPGVWEMVGVDEGCYSVRGLESWAATTTYLSYGAELTKEVWEQVNDSAVEVLPDGFRVHPGVGMSNSGLRQAGVGPAVGEETRTLACLVRTYTTAYIRYWLGSATSASFSSVYTGGKWQVLSTTRTLGDGDGTTVRIGNGPASENPVPFDVAGCWFTKSPTPGRACWGGEAPVTCAADRHTISTEGWPTERGEVSITFSVGVSERPSKYIFDTRQSGGNSWLLVRSSDGALQGATAAGTQPTISGAGLLPRDAPYHLRLKLEGGSVLIFRDGVQIGTWTGPMSWGTVAILGANGSATEPLNGPIRSLRIRSYEEVSP